MTRDAVAPLLADYSEAMAARQVRLRRAEGLAQGTGLGLFITRDIVRRHGGEIHAACDGDQWATFVFPLPATA